TYMSYLLDGYGVLVFRIVIFKISSFKLQNEELSKDESSHYLRGNHPNSMLAIEGNFNPGNNRNRAQGRVFGLVVSEAAQDPNVVTGTFFLNDHFATVLFDSGVDCSFISTNFLPLINMKPSVISPGYEIEINSDVKYELHQNQALNAKSNVTT
ncbi:reverse transcriptase domain-containing protein, partial [Tanacetum coccineum]